MIVTGDLHLTDKKADQYRFRLFDWLHTLRYQTCEPLVILGDLTDAKDNHSSWLVNTIVGNLSSLAQTFEGVIVLQGNHDLVSERSHAPAYFDFLNHLDHIEFVTQPLLAGGHDLRRFCSIDSGHQEEVLLMPHRRDFMEAWTDVGSKVDFSTIKLVFAHQTVHGSVSETGQHLEGVPPSLFSFDQLGGPVISGDVHVPQKVGKVHYTGSPYPIRFGDNFKPRLLDVRIEEDGVDVTPIYPPTITKHSLTIERITDLDAVHAKEGDQMKITYILHAAEFEEWPQYRKELRDWAKANGVELHSIEFVVPEQSEQSESKAAQGELAAASTETVLDRYAQREGISDDLLVYGKRIAG